MPADTGLIPLFEQKFSTYLELKLQQMGSLIRPHVSEQAFSGAKLASPLNQLGPVSMAAPSGERFGPKTITPQAYTRRWVAPNDRSLEQFIDTFDLLKTQIDPQSQFVAQAAAAVGRQYDDFIIAAATAAATIGADAGSLTTETFTTSLYQIAANFGGATSGLTVKKLNEARRILEHAHNDLNADPAVLVIGSNQHADLRDQAQVVSSDFNRNGGVLTDGVVSRFMGFPVVVSERLTQTTADTTRGCLLIVKSGVCLGVWKDQTTQIFQDFTREGNPWNVSTLMSAGATRTQLGKVVQILCADTTGADTPAS